MKLLNAVTANGNSQWAYTDGGEFVWRVTYSGTAGTTKLYFAPRDGNEFAPTALSGNSTVFDTANTTATDAGIEKKVSLGAGYYCANVASINSATITAELSPVVKRGRFYKTGVTPT